RQDPDAQAWWKGATDAVRAELMERAERQRSELEQTLAECAEVDRIAAWARGGKPSRAVLGVSELGKLAKLIEQHGDRRPPRYVTPAAMKHLKDGEDAADVNGDPLTFAKVSLNRRSPALGMEEA